MNNNCVIIFGCLLFLAVGFGVCDLVRHVNKGCRSRGITCEEVRGVEGCLVTGGDGMAYLEVRDAKNDSVLQKFSRPCDTKGSNCDNVATHFFCLQTNGKGVATMIIDDEPAKRA